MAGVLNEAVHKLWQVVFYLLVGGSNESQSIMISSGCA